MGDFSVRSLRTELGVAGSASWGSSQKAVSAPSALSWIFSFFFLFGLATQSLVRSGDNPLEVVNISCTAKTIFILHFRTKRALPGVAWDDLWF